MIVLSPEAEAFMKKPANVVSMPMIDDIYSINAASKWFVVYTNPQVETKVDLQLRASGIRSYLPISADWQKQSRRQKHMKAKKVRIERPLFARYLLVEMPVANPPFGKLFQIDGVRQVLSNDGFPIHIKPEVVEVLKDKQDKGCFDATVKQGRIHVPKWAVEGAKGYITDGPFATFSAMLMEVLANDRVTVETSIFGRATKIDLDIAQFKVLG